ncbi:hypothetical protein D3C80_1513320 [compost metagenome]
MCCTDDAVLGSTFLQTFHYVHNRRTGVDQILDNNRCSSLDIANHMGDHRFIVRRALLDHNGKRRVEPAGELLGHGGAARIGRDDHRISDALHLQISADQIERGQMIHRNIEEALDRCRM